MQQEHKEGDRGVASINAFPKIHGFAMAAGCYLLKHLSKHPQQGLAWLRPISAQVPKQLYRHRKQPTCATEHLDPILSSLSLPRQMSLSSCTQAMPINLHQQLQHRTAHCLPPTRALSCCSGAHRTVSLFPFHQLLLLLLLLLLLFLRDPLTIRRCTGHRPHALSVCVLQDRPVKDVVPMVPCEQVGKGQALYLPIHATEQAKFKHTPQQDIYITSIFTAKTHSFLCL
jgi:hypothetical protein